VDGAVEAAAGQAGAAGFPVRLGGSAGYPLPVGLAMAYLLDGADLTVDFRAENHGGRTAPFGVGFHPWLAAGPGGLEGATLTADVGPGFRSEARLLPGADAQGTRGVDFRGGRPAGE